MTEACESLPEECVVREWHEWNKKAINAEWY